jgi:hypothetical protein
MCRAKNVHVVEHEEVLEDEEFFIDAVHRNPNTVAKDEAYVNLVFNKMNVKLKIDTGSQVNIISTDIQ